jgi:hypothetical protein
MTARVLIETDAVRVLIENMIAFSTKKRKKENMIAKRS